MKFIFFLFNSIKLMNKYLRAASQNPINTFHVVFVSALLYSFGTNKFPDEYKPYLTYLAIGVASYHAYLLYKKA